MKTQPETAKVINAPAIITVAAMNNQSIRKASAECNCAPRRLLLLLLLPLRGARLVFISSFYTGLRVVTRSTTPFCIILCTHKYSIYGVHVSFYIRSTYNYIYDVIRITASYVYNMWVLQNHYDCHPQCIRSSCFQPTNSKVHLQHDGDTHYS